ncbi:MAG: hypothetical protein PHE83_03985 [Opitutaceae bacterium]|nr:hypothetical protein [Opitutaceae bacterium]
MSYRLLSFLTDVENVVQATAAATNGPRWETARIVDFHARLARLSFRQPATAGGGWHGHVQLQHFSLADGRICLKAHLSWVGRETPRTIEIYTVPGLDWVAQARQVAEAWFVGPPAAGTSVGPALAATG